MMARRSAIGAVALALAIACTACTAGSTGSSGSSGSSGSAGSPGWSPPGPTSAGGAGPGAITVGSFDFPESVLLAYLYAGALSARGYPVRVLPDLGSRELVEPALMTGLVQLVPEYTGSALEFVSLGRVHATADVTATASALASQMAARGIVTARPAAAQDANAIVVTGATAARYRLRTISDLARAAPGLVFGGPPECPERPDCLPGLRRTYGLRFQAFAALDAGGPLTRQALEAGDIGAALLFTTDPAIGARHLVELADNRDLQPAENVIPVLRRATADRYGPGLLAALDAVSARLSTAALTALNAQVELSGRDPRVVAQSWLRDQGLGRGAS
jgi:osmoprotectant transport system substrate-binding protein